MTKSLEEVLDEYSRFAGNGNQPYDEKIRRLVHALDRAWDLIEWAKNDVVRILEGKEV